MKLEEVLDGGFYGDTERLGTGVVRAVLEYIFQDVS
jgi:hypothetical protein